MAQYSYKARNNTGELVMGHLTAISEQDAITQLRQMQYTPVKITQGAVSKIQGAPKFLSMKFLNSSGRRVTLRDMVIFCTNLSSMTSAGIPLLNALHMCAQQLTNPHFVDVVGKVAQMVSEGSSFSEALALFPDTFSKFFINMIHAAEMSGTLDQVLKDMAVYMEKQDVLRQTIRGMFIYPAILLSASIGVIVLIITVVMPQFVQIFTKAGVPLPVPTKILYETGLWIKHYPFYYIPALVAILWGSKTYFKTNQGKDLWDHFVLKIPLVGSLMIKSLVARFCRTLATMLNTGVPMLQSFKIVEQVLGNNVFAKIVQDVHDSVEKGDGMHTALMRHSEFPKDVTYMISVGEKAGNIGIMLNKVADFYESKVQFEAKELMVLIEPSFVAIMGVCVGGILASMILPMFDMVKTIQR